MKNIFEKDYVHTRPSLNPVLRIQIRIRIHMFLGLLDPDPGPLVRALFFFHFFLLFDFLSLKNYVKVHLKSNMQKTFFSISFLLASWKSIMKIGGSGSGSGSRSISQRHGSTDPDPHRNVMDPQHCPVVYVLTQL